MARDASLNRDPKATFFLFDSIPVGYKLLELFEAIRLPHILQILSICWPSLKFTNQFGINC